MEGPAMTTTSEQGARGLGALVAQAGRLIAEVGDAAVALADAVEREALLEGERPALRARLAALLVGTPNGATQKPHSASSAGDAAALHPEYLSLGAVIASATRAKVIASGAYACATLRAKLAVAAVERGGER
jgi:hypothetical protein